MATVERIEQDLAALEEAIALLRAEFQSTYGHYLKLLGQAVRQQLILASYQICTQGYPESFLSLSFNRRQNLQQAILQLGSQVQEQLLSHLEPSKSLPQDDEASVDEAISEDEQLPEMTQEQLQYEFEMVEADNKLDTSDSEDDSLQTPPKRLLEWQEELEKAIASSLQTLSLDTNRLLQENGIIPDKLPPAVLEAAVQVEASEAAPAGSPNLLNLLMEAENDDGEPEDSKLMRIVAINLRLSEIEFADPSLSAGRNQIRKLSARMSSFGREYQKKQRERAIAQAEAAWRSSWFDE